jgi:hypothetical protein
MDDEDEKLLRCVFERTAEERREYVAKGRQQFAGGR